MEGAEHDVESSHGVGMHIDRAVLEHVHLDGSQHSERLARCRERSVEFSDLLALLREFNLILPVGAQALRVVGRRDEGAATPESRVCHHR